MARCRWTTQAGHGFPLAIYWAERKLAANAGSCTVLFQLVILGLRVLTERVPCLIWTTQYSRIWIFCAFFVIKPNRCTNFTNLFCHETLHVSDSSSVHHQEFIHCTLSNCVCHTGYSFRAEPGWNCSSILVLLESSLQTCMTYTIAECTVNKLLMMDRGNVRNM